MIFRRVTGKEKSGKSQGKVREFCADISVDTLKCFNLLVRISVNIKVLKPGKTGHAPFNGYCICSIKMPNFSQTGGGGILKLTLQ